MDLTRNACFNLADASSSNKKAGPERAHWSQYTEGNDLTDKQILDPHQSGRRQDATWELCEAHIRDGTYAFHSNGFWYNDFEIDQLVKKREHEDRRSSRYGDKRREKMPQQQPSSSSKSRTQRF